MHVKHIFYMLLISAIFLGCLGSKTQVSPAPYMGYLKVGENTTFKYSGKSVKIDFRSENDYSVFTIEVDGTEKMLKVKKDSEGKAISDTISGLHIVIKPVEWEERNGQLVPIYEKSWNSSEVYFEIWR